MTIFNTLINYPKVLCFIKSANYQLFLIAMGKPVNKISHTQQIHILFLLQNYFGWEKGAIQDTTHWIVSRNSLEILLYSINFKYLQYPEENH